MKTRALELRTAASRQEVVRERRETHPTSLDTDRGGSNKKDNVRTSPKYARVKWGGMEWTCKSGAASDEALRPIGAQSRWDVEEVGSPGGLYVSIQIAGGRCNMKQGGEVAQAACSH